MKLVSHTSEILALDFQDEMVIFGCYNSTLGF